MTTESRSFTATTRADELDRTSFAEFRDRILRTEQQGVVHQSRSHPGAPRVPLPRQSPRWLARLDAALLARRSRRHLSTTLPSRRVLARMLEYAHGVHASRDRGPVASAGGLQALELYVAPMTTAPWLERAVHHYDRREHALARIADGRDRAGWLGSIPSMGQFEGGALLWLMVGDGRRVTAKYGERAFRFLAIEAGHLMQNLCLLSASLGWCTLPLGGFYEREILRGLRLPSTDLLLYVGACGRPLRPVTGAEMSEDPGFGDSA